jgi:hypothetical protein
VLTEEEAEAGPQVGGLGVHGPVKLLGELGRGAAGQRLGGVGHVAVSGPQRLVDGRLVAGLLGVDDLDQLGGVFDDGALDDVSRQLVVHGVDRGAELLGVGLELGHGRVLADRVALGGGLGVGDELRDVLVASPQTVERLANLGAVGGTDGRHQVGGVAVARAVESGGERFEAGGVAAEGGTGGQRGQVDVLREQVGQAGPECRRPGVDAL